MAMFIYLTSEHTLKLVPGTETISWLIYALNMPLNQILDFLPQSDVTGILWCFVKSKFLLCAYKFLTTLFIFMKDIHSLG